MCLPNGVHTAEWVLTLGLNSNQYRLPDVKDDCVRLLTGKPTRQLT